MTAPSVLEHAPHWPALTAEVHHKRLKKALAKAQRLQEKLASNPKTPTFKNTIVALERIGDTVRVAQEPFNMAVTFDAREDLVAVDEAMAEPLTCFFQGLYQDSRIWKRVQSVQASWATESVGPDAAWLLEQTRLAFLQAGAHLPKAVRQDVQAWQGTLAQHSVTFGKRFLAATQEPAWFTDRALLTGLPEATIAAASARAAELGRPDDFAFHRSMPNVREALEWSTSPEFRRALWSASEGRCRGGEHDTTELIRDQLRLRSKVARALGYDNWASYILSDQMAGSPQQAEALLRQVWDRALPQFQQEAQRIETLRAERGEHHSLHPGDWFYWAEQVRQADYAFDGQALREYLPRDAVRQGLFDVVHRLFGISFEAHPELPVFAERVDTYRVMKGRKEVGLLYVDDFQRPTKNSGAWMDVAQSQSGLEERRPIVGNALNMADDSAHPLMTMEEVVTAFHELGHGLHGLLSQVRYTSQSGTQVPTDFVELPSQLLERWATEPSVLRTFARHHETNEPIPEALIERWQKASQFNEGFAQGEYLLAAFLDLRVHQLSPEAIETLDLDAFTQQIKDELGCPALLEPRYTLNYFSHAFEGDYSARYYAYLWSAVLDADVFSKFQEAGLFDAQLAKSLRTNIYASGHSRPVLESFEAFMGRGPDVSALMRAKGWEAPAEVAEATPSRKRAPAMG